MNKFEQLHKNIRKLANEKVITGLLVQAASNYEAELIDLNTSQLEEGLLSSGKRTPEYSNSDYAKQKLSMGSKSGNHYDYKLDGDFYEGWKVEFKGTKIKFDSLDEKAEKLTSPPYGSKDVYGLTEDNKENAAQYFKEDFIEKFKKQFLNGL